MYKVHLFQYKSQFNTVFSVNQGTKASQSVYFTKFLNRQRADRPKNRGSIPGRSKRFFSSPLRPDGFWGPSGVLSNGYRGAAYSGVKQRAFEAVTHFPLAPRLRMVDLNLLSSIRLSDQHNPTLFCL
jgi:hypothetical protein